METPQGSPAAASTPPPPARGGSPLSPTLALTAGWKAFLANPWVSIGVLLVLFAIQLVGNFIPVINVLFSILVTPSLYAGGAWFFLRGIRGEDAPFESAFEGFQRWPSVTGAMLIIGGVMLLIAMPLLVMLFLSIGAASLLSSGSGHMPDLSKLAMAPFFGLLAITYPVFVWWGARTSATYFIVMEADRPGAVESLRRSFALTRGSVWRIVGLYLLCIPVALLGCLALCVGIVPASIVMYFAFAHAYEQLRARAA